MKALRRLGEILHLIEAGPKYIASPPRTEVLSEGRHVSTSLEIECHPAQLDMLILFVARHGVDRRFLTITTQNDIINTGEESVSVTFSDARPLAFWRQEVADTPFKMGYGNSEVWSDPIVKTYVDVRKVED